MPGKPHSPHCSQQKPYVSWLKNGNYLDKAGNIVSSRDSAAHIPFDQFIYGD